MQRLEELRQLNGGRPVSLVVSGAVILKASRSGLVISEPDHGWAVEIEEPNGLLTSFCDESTDKNLARARGYIKALSKVSLPPSD